MGKKILNRRNLLGDYLGNNNEGLIDIFENFKRFIDMKLSTFISIYFHIEIPLH